MKFYFNIFCIFLCFSTTPVFSQIIDEIVVTGNKSESLLLNNAGKKTIPDDVPKKNLQFADNQISKKSLLHFFKK